MSFSKVLGMKTALPRTWGGLPEFSHTKQFPKTRPIETASVEPKNQPPKTRQNAAVSKPHGIVLKEKVK